MENIRITKDTGSYKEGQIISVQSEYVEGLVKSGSAERISVKKIITKRITK